MSLSDGSLCCYKERGCYPGRGGFRWHPGFERPPEQQRPVPECATRPLSIFNRQSPIGNRQFSFVPVPMHRGPVPTFFVGMRHPRLEKLNRGYPPTKNKECRAFFACGLSDGTIARWLTVVMRSAVVFSRMISCSRFGI
jgi:hypothetical protein